MKSLWLPVLLLIAACASADTKQDLQSILIYHRGMQGVVSFAASRPDLFPAVKEKESRVLSREQKEAIWATWKPFLDYLLALDSMRKTHEDFMKLRGADRSGAFLAYYASFLTQYRYAIEFVMLADRDPGMNVLLNEPVPELGLGWNTYAVLKQRFLLNPVKSGGWTALEALYRSFRIREWPDVRAAIEADTNFLQEMSKGKRQILTAMNAWDMAEKLTLDGVFPVQSGVSEWMGDTKVLRRKLSLINEEQIRSMMPKLEPGDVLLERREWYISNVGLPGYWPHAALYVGTPEERNKYFADPEVKAWLQSQGASGGSLDDFLRLRSPSAYKTSLEAYMGHTPRILEAMSEGVTFTSIEHSAEADSVAVLRPRLPKKEKALAIVRAFHYAGRPYDFNFDFRTDSSIVCTELVFKAYEPGTGNKGWKFPLIELMGRWTAPANELVKQFDAQYGSTDQQTDFILFLDGFEKEKKAVESNLASFRESWKRPKWHIFVQGK